MLDPRELKLDPGTIVAGKYRVERMLAIGGMGVVVSAWHVELERRVALKFLVHQSYDDAELQDERFLREARSVSQLTSDHIVRVFDVGRLDERTPFMVMELLEGTDLEDARAGGPMPIAEVIDYITQAARGLADAHAAGLVHRDIKPANIFLAQTASGRPTIKVVDFGIAKNVTRKSIVPLTGPRVVLGSPAYMSPEQLRAEDVGPASDVWSLGVTFYELLTGVVPFAGETEVESSASILKDEPIRPSLRRPEIPAEVDEIILRCLRKSPSDRFRDGRGLVDALARLATGAVVAGARVDAPTDRPLSSGIARPQPRRSATLRAAIVVGLVICGGIVGVFAIARRETGAERPPSASASAAPASSPVAASANPEGAVTVGKAARSDDPRDAGATSHGPLVARGRGGRGDPGGRSPSSKAVHESSPEPAPVSTPTTPPAPTPTETPAPRFSVATARVDVGAATNVVGAKAASMTRVVAGAAGRLTACYRNALPSLTGVIEGAGTLHIETDDEGLIIAARVSSAVALAPACVAAAVGGRKVPDVDTGRARADVPLVFHAQ